MHLTSVIKQKSYEHIEYTLRRDPVTFVPQVLLLAVLLLVGAGLFWLLTRIFPPILTHPLGFPALVLAGSIYFLSVWLFSFTHFVDYWLDLWIVTNDRIVNIEQQGLFARTISELDLFRIQDVTSEVKGFFPTMFNYGNVYIQTAAAHPRFTFEQVPNPHEIRKAILDLAEEDRKHHEQPPAPLIP